MVFFNLLDDYPEANHRHYHFMVEGLLEVKKNLKDRGIDFYLLYGELIKNILKVSHRASVVVCDKGYLKFERRWRREYD